MSSKQIPIFTRTHGDIQVFHIHFADFANFKGLDNTENQEGMSVQDVYMGCIVERVERLNSMKTE